ncbi:hypothetical protein [Achromobacter xylosoxidans]|uniref:hypothetical protein n=1 Tax=Alcaligenes xylosoxydans xylosoxydans TaxID=85698 RepID=UPI003D2A6B03
MTQQDDITQRVRDNATQILDAIRSAGYRDHPTNIERKRVDAILSAVEPLLSKLRAPVADERAQDVDLPWLRAYMHHQIASDRWVVTADQARDFARAAVLADRQARDALASAPVAGEAVYTLSVKGVFHNWKPTTVAFSIPDGEHQLFLRPAAPQVSECECSRKSKAVSDSEAQL